MNRVRFEHFMTFTSAANIDDYLKEYVAQGFVASPGTARHPYGLRNGSVEFGPDYLELCWVEDATLFATGNSELHALRAALHPHGIGLLTYDAQAQHDAWVARGYAMPNLESRIPRDAPPGTLPAWSIQDIPAEMTPGVLCFAVAYAARPINKAQPVVIPPNAVYAISGVTIVTAEPEKRAAGWRDFLAPCETVQTSEAEFGVWIGPHWAVWMTPEHFESAYGLPWKPPAHRRGELGLLHLLAVDLSVAEMMLQRAGRHTRPMVVNGEASLLVAPDAHDGFTFLIWQQPIATWMQERMARSGENLYLSG